MNAPSTYCPRCGTAISSNTRFCTRCGAALAPSAPASGEAQPANWHLVVRDGPAAGQRYALRQQTGLGRGQGEDIPLDDPLASRQHALIQYSQGQPVITDSGSRNGTYVNGARIDRPTPLTDGDLIRIGNTTLRLSASRSAASSAGTSAAPPPPAPAPAPQPPAAAQAPPGERPVGIIPAVEHKKGLFRSQSFNLVLTMQHLVFARLTSEMLREASKRAKEEAKAQGKGFFGQWGASMKGNSALVERYYQMPVESILREHPDNFAIPIQEVRQVKTKRGSSDPEYSQPDQLIIQARDKIKLNLKGCSAAEAKKTLRQVLGSRVK